MPASGKDANHGRRSAGTGDSQNREPLSLDKRRAVIAVILAVMLAGGAFTAIGQLAHFGKISSAIAHAEKLWLPACLFGQLLAYLGYMLAYHDVARADGGPRFSFTDTARIVVFGAGAAVFAASVGGLAVDYWALRRTGTKPRVATRRVLAVGTLEWVVLSIYAWIAAVLVLATGQRAPLAMTLAWLTVIPACVLGARWFTAPSRVHRFIDLPPPGSEASRPRRGPRRALGWVAREARISLANGIAGVVLVRHLLSHPLRYRGGAIGYPVYWAGDMLTLYASVRAFGGHVDPIGLILAYATGIVISSLPLPAGGAGGVEAAIAFALHGVGIALAPALVAVFLYRIVTFWLPILPALALIPSLRRLHDRLPQVPHTDPDRDERLSFRPPAQSPA